MHPNASSHSTQSNEAKNLCTLQGTDISPANALLKMIFIDVPFFKVGYVSFLEVTCICICSPAPPALHYVYIYAPISCWKVSHNKNAGLCEVVPADKAEEVWMNGDENACGDVRDLMIEV